MSTVRLRLLVAYDGRPFRGWQSQAGGGAVQDFLEVAFAKLCGDDGSGARVPVHGAGRTDAGVHALGQVAQADVPAEDFRRFPFEKWSAALNAHLPPEIRVERVTRAPAGWHARFSTRGKVYRYRLWNAASLSPFEVGRSWHLPGVLDVGLLRETAGVFIGRHDFSAFAANRGRSQPDTTVRTIRRAAVRRGAGGDLVTLEFEGDGFLYHQVRLMVGTLARVAQGKMAAETLTGLLGNVAGRKTSFAAPAEGLYLLRVLYGKGASRKGREGRKGFLKGGEGG